MNSLYKIYLRYQALIRAFKSTKLYSQICLIQSRIRRLKAQQSFELSRILWQYILSKLFLLWITYQKFNDDKERIINDLAFYDRLYIQQNNHLQKNKQNNCKFYIFIISFYKESLVFSGVRGQDQQKKKMILEFQYQEKLEKNNRIQLNQNKKFQSKFQGIFQNS
ncbi:unnamed protein product [Paramecium pentaurelia]|uniref:Uncharacterized protein n=1 Tax=Paramecium pentaurelia TaxID=43138 RepID=A0A8S1UY01_9CILI|nr:unnamed protein product [Paramecium pentaurelia]